MWRQPLLALDENVTPASAVTHTTRPQHTGEKVEEPVVQGSQAPQWCVQQKTADRGTCDEVLELLTLDIEAQRKQLWSVSDDFRHGLVESLANDQAFTTKIGRHCVRNNVPS